MEYNTTIGIDVSDKNSKICVMSKEEDKRVVVIETTCETTKAGFTECLSKFDPSWLVVFETGTHCRWMKEHIEKLGFKVIVANPAAVKLITESNAKNDRNDARKLARLALADIEFLKPVKLRSEKYQLMLRYHESRLLLMKARTSAIAQVRCFAKSMGFRLPTCSTECFHKLDKSSWPSGFEVMVWPMMDTIETLTLKIAAYDSMIAKLAETPEFKEQVERVRNIVGVGDVGSTVVVAALGGDVQRFRHARDVGPYFGMTPKTFQSGESNPQLGTTKAGNALVRKVLMECAHVVMQENSKDTDLKLKGLRISSHGGRIAKKKAAVAVARGLAVLIVAILKDPKKEYVPLSKEGEEGFRRYRAEQEYLAMKGKSSKKFIA